jgi:hypothetical protein
VSAASGALASSAAAPYPAHMRAEAEHHALQIKQALDLLRRFL